MIRLVLRRLFSFAGRERVLPCREVTCRLSEFVDRELGPEMMGKIHEHLAVCAACRRFVESLERTSRMLRLDPSLPMPDEAARKLMAALREEYRRAQWEIDELAPERAFRLRARARGA